MPARGTLWDDDEERGVRFLLGVLSAEDQTAVEDRMLVDAGFHEELKATSDDLIRAYLAGKLAPADVRRFEQHFLASSLRRERYEFVRALMAAVKEELGQPRAARPARPVRALAPFWATAATLLLAVGVWWLARSDQGPHVAGPSVTPPPVVMPAPAPAATAIPAGRAVRTEPPRSRTRHAAEAQVVRLPITPDAPVEVPLARDRRLVRLEVPIEGGRHPTYDAEIRAAAGGDPVWEARALMPRAPGEPLVLEVPARVLVADAYELRVSGERLRDETSAGDVSRRYTLHIARPR